MKNITCAIIVLTIFGILPYNAYAWNNADVHMEINKFAFELFESDIMPKDLSFDNTCLCGDNSLGYAWDKEDGVERINQKFKPGQNIKQKPIKEWIIQGGFSADEPEGPMALRHFYDPTRNSGNSWITDSQFVTNLLHIFASTTIVNPEIDAKTWAIDADDRGDEGTRHNERTFLAQDYSWYDAKKNFIRALAEDDNNNVYYGMAWRGVGETMHMVSDMTLPAHVRNDGHAALGLYFGLISPKTPIFGKMLTVIDPDPVEYYTDEKDVRKYRSESPSSSINYNQPIDKLMDQLAIWTNSNFLSKDTIPIPGKGMRNGATYPSPNITGRIPDKDYIWHDVDRRPTRLVKATPRYWGILTNEYDYEIDNAVRNSQNAFLIPTAIRASATVLDRFLPRFEVKMQITQEIPAYTIHGELKFKDKYNEWNAILGDKRFKVNNGAYVIVNGKRKDIPKQINGDYTAFTTNFEAMPGDTIHLEYDFGGYVIESEPYQIPLSLKLGVWRFTGKPTWPNEIAIVKNQNDEISATYTSPMGIPMHVTFAEKPVDLDTWLSTIQAHPEEKKEFYEEGVREGFFTAGQKTINTFLATWHNPAPDICTIWDVHVNAFIYDNGKKFIGVWTENFDCADKGSRSYIDDTMKGEWLREYSGPVDGGYAQSKNDSVPVGNNPFANYRPEIEK